MTFIQKLGNGPSWRPLHRQIEEKIRFECEWCSVVENKKWKRKSRVEREGEDKRTPRAAIVILVFASVKCIFAVQFCLEGGRQQEQNEAPNEAEKQHDARRTKRWAEEEEVENSELK